LKEDAGEDNCRILSNARCLSEGVDVPALDAIMFLHPRKSQIDVVQSVGRVMRKAPDKKMGYVILPVGVPAGVAPEEALNNNEKYKVVWQILNALRAHDDRFDATINKMELGVDVSGQIEIIAVTNDMPNRTKPEATGLGIGQGSDANNDENPNSPTISEPVQTSFLFDEISSAIMAKIVKKCGRRTYWEDWATDIGKVAQTHITRIKALVAQPGSPERKAFEDFLNEIRDDLNDSISEEEAIEMLAQHIITKPVFEALFEGYNFTRENPVSRAMQGVLDALDEHNLEKESDSLRKFYADVKIRASGIDNAEGKQKIVVELYDKFFRNAFPKMTEKLGIVYTPVEVVDFIIHSVNDVLQQEFGQTLGGQGVHILDPFTGTGTFITRLLQSGLIKPEELAHKYAHEIHANEIVLLAYYIAAINIEAVYHSLVGGEYSPFEGICLTDTFQLYEKEDLVSHLMVDNSSRRQRQKELDIRVIVGNPPYSAGQNSANDNNANIAYPGLDSRIRQTYAAHSTATLKNALYDSYIRAIRWGSDRLGDAGIMAYVSNAGWIDGNATDGLRKCLVDEFSSLYVFHLRGNQRTSGELSRKEGGKIFGSGSRAPIAITLFVKNPLAKERGKIHFHDVGDYLSREEKLRKIEALKSVSGITATDGWTEIVPDDHNDWLNQRDGSFDQFIKIGDKKDKSTPQIFETYSAGVKTNRDGWCYNFSKKALEENIKKTLAVYNSEVERYAQEGKPELNIREFVSNDPKRISWDQAQYEGVEKGQPIPFLQEAVFQGLYRPFMKEWAYYTRTFNNRVYQMPRIFLGKGRENRVIQINTSFRGNGNFALMSDLTPDLHCNGDGQCFPLWLYTELDPDISDLFSQANASPSRFDAINDTAHAHFANAYPAEKFSKEDIFYYIYGLLHSEEYRELYADNLSKELPRIPCVKKPSDFWTFVEAGRKLGDLHVGFEGIDPFPATYRQGSLSLATIKDPESFYRVEKMKFGGKRPNVDKSTVVYNSNITMTGIPVEAYDYVVNGKPALEWVMERQCIKTDKDSGIVNDANRYAIETVGDPAYPLKLFQRIITVSLETMKIVRSLPKLDI
jgi:predicted helicase